MLILSGTFLKIEQADSKDKKSVNNFLKILDDDVVYSVKVPSLNAYLSLSRGEAIEIPVKVNVFNNRLYYQLNA